MGLRCWIFGHDFERPVDPRRGRASYKVCTRCRRVMIRDYYGGWLMASSSERTHYLSVFDALDDDVQQHSLPAEVIRAPVSTTMLQA